MRPATAVGAVAGTGGCVMSNVVRSMPRRAILAAAMLVLVATAGVLMAGGAGAAIACGGSQGQAALLGCSNTASATTVITVPGDSLSGLWVSETGASSWGIRADGTDRGVSGSGATGVYGSGIVGVQATGTDTGIAATGTNSDGLGVNGTGAYGVEGSGSIVGVIGVSNGIGVKASSNSSSAVALQVLGRSQFSTAGTAVIASGQKKVTVSLAGVTTSDFVLATVQGSGSFYVKNATAGTGQFTIAINKAPAAPNAVTVAYFVISAS